MPFDLPLDYLIGLAVWLGGLAVMFVLLLRLRRTWGRASPGRVKGVNAGLSLWMFLAALTVVELYFAVVYDQSDSFNMSLVSKHWFQRHVVYNEAGFRDARPLTRQLPPGVRRVCFVGDSFTYGHGVKDVADRFSDRVGARLEAARPGQFLVSNIGEAGINAAQVTNFVNVLVQHGFPIDVVVYVICLNDIEGAADSEYYERLAVQSPRFFLFQNSFFLNMLYFRIQQARMPQVRNYYSELASAYEGEAWNRMRERLEELQYLCDDHQIDLRIAIFPFLHNLGPAYPFDAGHEKIADFCRRESIACLDLKPVLLAHVGEGLTVNRFDAHPNERANALVAEALERDLLADLFARQP